VSDQRILDDILKVASDNYTAEPNQVLWRSVEFFLKTLSVHVGIVKSLEEAQGKVFDEETIVKKVFADLERQILDNLRKQRKPTNIITMRNKIL
jgi:hypothetical protein